jgi:ssRNA-specific RNase YbeY (16S rRNA maturation enzyme)
VRSEVKRYNDKRHDQDSDTKILSFLSPTDISGQLQTGKVDFAAITNMTMANQQKAIDDALLAFKDGLFLVFVNDEEIRTLDAALLLSEDSEIAFIRMTFLTGTYW